jgi:LysR family glycine cleavage system transcriptional activator
MLRMNALHRLPNLSALRAFEAAARHENFSRAADEIHVTHGAISHQVRALEAELGVPLFTRNGKRVAITPQGLRFAQTVRNAFEDIADGVQQVRAHSQQKRLTVSCLPSFAARWLAPRLGKFIEAFPDTELVLQSSGQLQDLVRDGIDVGIRFGSGQYPGMEVELLMGDSYYPVASPQYQGGHLPKSPAQLKGARLLLSDEPWAPWLQAAKVAMTEPTGGVRFQDMSFVIRAALDGEGIGLVRHVVAEQEIAQGSLLRLFDVAVKCESQYYLAYPPGASDKPQVAAFLEWLRGEVARFKAQAGDLVA